MKRIGLFFSFICAAISLCAQTDSKYPIEVKVEGNFTSFTLGNFSSEVSAKSIYDIWHNRPHSFFDSKDRSELETQIYLESEEGKEDLVFFNGLRNRIKKENCKLEIRIRELVPDYSVDKRKLCLMKAEQIWFLVPNKLQFEEIVLNKPSTIEIINNQVTNTVAWNYYCLPISDLQIAQKIVQEKNNLMLRIEFLITNVNIVPNSFLDYHMTSDMRKMEIVDSNNQVIWRF